MNRRKFLAVSGAASLAPLGDLASAAPAAPGRDYYLLQQYQVDSDAQRTRLDAYLSKAALPALNRAGIQPVGVFVAEEGPGPIWLVLPGPSPDVLLGHVDALLADKALLRQGADVVAAVKSAAAFTTMDSALLRAFQGMPRLEKPVAGAGRVFQLRIYESPSLATARKKIEMFNDAGEIAIFRRVGLNPVFFGETLVGPSMPNLTYMLAFSSREQQLAAWQKFRTDPEWLRLRAMPEYADDTILRKVNNLLLKPAPYSQI